MNQYKTKHIGIALLSALILVSLSVTLVEAITIDGPYNFQGPQGGNVRYANALVSNRVSVIGTLYRFANFIQGGTNYGVLGFDCDTGTNMTITGVTLNTLTYTIAGAGVNQQYVYFAGRSPSSQTGADNFNQDPATDITTVTTTGGVTIVLQYSDVSETIRQGSGDMIDLFQLLAIILIFGSLGHETDDTRIKLMTYIIAVTAVMAIAYIIAQWGY